MTKFAVLRSIGHNLADSLGSGVSLLVGAYEGYDIYAEAAAAPDGSVEIDFLAGRATNVSVSPVLAEVLARFVLELPEFCARHGARPDDFAGLAARFSGTPANPKVTVTVTNRAGRRASDHYVGSPARRPKTLDPLGRVRRSG